MTLTIHKTIQDFHAATFETLMRHESQNMILLGNIFIGLNGEDKTEWRDPANWVMVTVQDVRGILLTALMTPPHNITLYAIDNIVNHAAIDCLIKGLRNYEIPGVTTEKSLAEEFAKAYGKQYEITMNQRIYELTVVNPDIPTCGTLRLAEEKDMSFLPFWLSSFFPSARNDETMPIPIEAEPFINRIDRRNLWILENEDGVPVSMVGSSRELVTVRSIAPVYTPPYFRGRGYASSSVAQLSRLLLDKGFTRCVLYTDLANPTSNSIYQKIGYRAICNSLELKFVTV